MKTNIQFNDVKIIKLMHRFETGDVYKLWGNNLEFDVINYTKLKIKL